MNEILSKLAPIMLTFLSGVMLKKTRIVDTNDGATLLKIVFFVSLPALIMRSLSETNLSATQGVLPIIAAIVVSFTYALTIMVKRFWSDERRVFGVALVGTMLMNLGFVYPFIFAITGQEGLTLAIIFDLGNSLMALSVVYATACRYGCSSHQENRLLKNLLASPPLWAMIIALLLNGFHIAVSEVYRACFAFVGNLSIPLTLLALGIYFTPHVIRPSLLITVIGIRVIGGLLSGLLLARLFGLHGLSMIVVAACSAAPVGLNTLTFAMLAELDAEFAASLVSVSIGLGLVYIPILIYVMKG